MKEPQNLHRQVVEKMIRQDKFSQWLGIEILEVREGYCRISMVLREEMVNGFSVIHGGIPFSFADSAFAFACNNRNNLSLALDTSITFVKKSFPGDRLFAEAKEIHNGRSTGLYSVTITNSENATVAVFKGTCFRTGESLLEVSN